MIQHIYKILNEGKREYSNNKIFSLIDKLIATINGVPSLIELYLAISEDKVEGLDTPRDAIVISNSDSRIMHLMVSAFKGFPKADKTFGIDFRDVRENNKPSSTVILGSNGIGKTSIYTALEMVSMNHSYIGDIYGYNTQLRQQAFVRNVDSLYEHLLCSIFSPYFPAGNTIYQSCSSL